MTPEQLATKVAATRAAQGLPPHVQDAAALERCAAIFRLVDPVALERARAELRAAAEGE